MPFSESLVQFNGDYLRLTMLTAKSCENNDITDSMVIGTSAIIDTEIDGAVGMNSGIFNNPFIIWSRYHKGLFKTTLKLSPPVPPHADGRSARGKILAAFAGKHI